jgi:hypothetical protein
MSSGDGLLVLTVLVILGVGFVATLFVVLSAGSTVKFATLLLRR